MCINNVSNTSAAIGIRPSQNLLERSRVIPIWLILNILGRGLKFGYTVCAEIPVVIEVDSARSAVAATPSLCCLDLGVAFAPSSRVEPVICVLDFRFFRFTLLPPRIPTFGSFGNNEHSNLCALS